MSVTIPVATPEELADHFDRFQKQGCIIEVKWGIVSGKAWISKFTRNSMHEGRVSWMMTLNWIEEPAQDKAGYKLEMSTEAKSLLSKLKDFKKTCMYPAEWWSENVLDPANHTLAAVGEGIDLMSDTVNEYLDVVDSTYNVLQYAAHLPTKLVTNAMAVWDRLQAYKTEFENFCTSMEDTLAFAHKICGSTSSDGDPQSLIDMMTGQTMQLPLEGIAPNGEIKAPVNQNTGVLTNQTENFYTPLTSAYNETEKFVGPIAQLRMNEYALKTEILVNAMMISIMEFIVVVEGTYDIVTGVTSRVYGKGTDLRRVAREFYGNEDRWIEISMFNRMDGSILQETKVIVIPGVH